VLVNLEKINTLTALV